MSVPNYHPRPSAFVEMMEVEVERRRRVGGPDARCECDTERPLLASDSLGARPKARENIPEEEGVARRELASWCQRLARKPLVALGSLSRSGPH